MSEEQDRFQVQPQQPQSVSPTKQTNTESNLNVLLSPKPDQTKKILSQQSPSATESKLNMLRKIYQDTIQKRNDIGDVDTAITEKNNHIQSLKGLLQAKKADTKKNAESAQKINQKNSQVQTLQQLLQNAKQNNAKAQQADKISQLKIQIELAHQKIIDKENQIRSGHISSHIQNKISELSQALKKSEELKTQKQSSVSGSQHKISQLKAQIEGLHSKILQHQGKSKNLTTVHELEAKQRSIEQNLKNKRLQKQRIASQLQANKTRQNKSESVEPDRIVTAKSSIEQLKRKLSQVQKQIQRGKKQHEETSHKIKTNDKHLDKQKAKQHQINQSIKKLQDEKHELEQKITEGHKKPQYTEKLPEELIAIRKKKQHLTQKLKKQAEQTQHQQNKVDNLVPPVVLQNLKAKVTNIHEKNQRYSRLIVESSLILEENKRLDAEKQALQWEINPDLKAIDQSKVREEVKANSLEEDVNQLRKKNVQVNTKLQQYVRQYPDFKPQKKIKKPQPVVPAQPIKKESQPQQKGNKKKKNNKQQQVVEKIAEVQQKPVPEVVENKKAPSKKQESKSPQNKKQKSTIENASKKQQQKPKKQNQLKRQSDKTSKKQQEKPSSKKQGESQIVKKEKDTEKLTKVEEQKKDELLKVQCKLSLEANEPQQGKKNKKKK